MIGHGNPALRAFYCFSAGSTAQKIIVATSVDKQYGLIFILLILQQPLTKGGAERGYISRLYLCSHILHDGRGENSAAVAVIELYELVFSVKSFFVALK